MARMIPYRIEPSPDVDPRGEMLRQLALIEPELRQIIKQMVYQVLGEIELTQNARITIVPRE